MGGRDSVDMLGPQASPGLQPNDHSDAGGGDMAPVWDGGEGPQAALACHRMTACCRLGGGPHSIQTGPHPRRNVADVGVEVRR